MPKLWGQALCETLSCFPAVLPRVSSFISLCLGVLIGKMGLIIVSPPKHSRVGKDLSYNVLRAVSTGSGT